MHQTVQNLIQIKEEIKEEILKKNIADYEPNVIAVSKTFKINKILPLIEHGHIDYGENKVQEAVEKWSVIKKVNKNIKLHLIGRLQTNKVKFALKLFDYIHSLDSKKLADKISHYQNEQNIQRKFFIQVNIGKEEQKSGVLENEIQDFYDYCKNLNLNILGLMCIPPFDQDSTEYFIKMRELNNKIGLNDLSMGMSADYFEAIKYNATFVRIGSSIFGERS